MTGSTCPSPEELSTERQVVGSERRSDMKNQRKQVRRAGGGQYTWNFPDAGPCRSLLV